MEVEPLSLGKSAKPDLFSTLFSLGNKLGIGIKDLPALIKGIGEAAREVKELNREMPILDVIKGLNELIKQRDQLKGVIDDVRNVSTESPE